MSNLGVAYVSGSDTSRQAAASMVESAASIRAYIAVHIRSCGLIGATCDEVEFLMDLRHQTASARIRELALANRVIDSGVLRTTRSGRNAIVWVSVNGGAL